MLVLKSRTDPIDARPSDVWCEIDWEHPSDNAVYRVLAKPWTRREPLSAKRFEQGYKGFPPLSASLKVPLDQVPEFLKQSSRAFTLIEGGLKASEDEGEKDERPDEPA